MNFLNHGPESSETERKRPILIMPPPSRKPSRWQLWRNRLFLVEFVFVCLMLGILLITVPWTPYWSSNSLLSGFPRVHEFLMNDFVRGLISGLGVIDVWLAVSEAVHYRENAD